VCFFCFLFVCFFSSSSLIGVATEKEKRKIFGESSSRSISFLHTERMVGDGRSQQEDEEVAKSGSIERGGGRGLTEPSPRGSGSAGGAKGGGQRDKQETSLAPEESGPIEEVVEVCSYCVLSQTYIHKLR